VSVDALQSCLAAEDAAIYGYGVVGGVLAGVAAESPEQKVAMAAYEEHVRRRDDLTQRIVDSGAEPVAAQPAYALPRPVETRADCREVARLVEDRCAQTYADAVSRTVAVDRELTARALTSCALRTVAWGAPAQAFPGIPEP
jgi:hypothetical protein